MGFFVVRGDFFSAEWRRVGGGARGFLCSVSRATTEGGGWGGVGDF